MSRVSQTIAVNNVAIPQSKCPYLLSLIKTGNKKPYKKHEETFPSQQLINCFSVKMSCKLTVNLHPT